MIYESFPAAENSQRYPIRAAFQNFYDDYASTHSVSPTQDKAAACIASCKSGKLGYTIEECPDCGYQKIHARSCNNRNCPCCQAPMEQKWIMERNSELVFGMAYYHVTFTLPHELNPLILENQKLLYNLLFSAASDTLITLCRDKKYMGALKDFHSSKALCLTGAAKTLVDSKQWQALLDTLYKKEWVPFIKKTFNGNGNAIKYLARYAYRTAISNARASDVNANTVTVSYKDYADNSAKKQMVLAGTEFIRRFLQHVLPQGVHRVRFSGYLANCKKTKCLTLIGNLMRTPYTGSPTKGKRMSELLEMIYGTDTCACPKCKTRMFTCFIRAPEVWKLNTFSKTALWAVCLPCEIHQISSEKA